MPVRGECGKQEVAWASLHGVPRYRQKGRCPILQRASIEVLPPFCHLSSSHQQRGRVPGPKVGTCGMMQAGTLVGLLSVSVYLVRPCSRCPSDLNHPLLALCPLSEHL